MMELMTDIFGQFDREWALLTAGDSRDFNMMTISWGGLGTIWGKPVATVYVRTTRHTHEYLDREDFFTISFYPDEYKELLGTLGRKSGRDMDKIHDSGLKVKPLSKSVTFEEAKMTLVCRKLFRQPLDPARITDEKVRAFYEGDALHDMYIGEVVEILRK